MSGEDSYLGIAWETFKILLLYLPVLFVWGFALAASAFVFSSTFAPGASKRASLKLGLLTALFGYALYKWTFWGYGWVGELYEGRIFDLLGPRLAEWGIETVHLLGIFLMAFVTVWFPTKIVWKALGPRVSKRYETSARFAALGLFALFAWMGYAWWGFGEVWIRSAIAAI